jgi:hypothetical protein
MYRSRTFILTIVSVSVTVAALWWTNHAVTPREATWEDARAEEQRGGYPPGHLDGRERRGLRLMDYLPPDQFVERMNKLVREAPEKGDGHAQG